MPTLTPGALRNAGLDALRRELGGTGTVRFLQQFEMGSSDYTAERWQWLPTGLGVAGLAAMIREETARHESPGA